MMRRSTTLILALAAVLVAGIVQASESPTLNAALELVHRVGSYTLRHPDAPGAFPAWAGDVVPSGEPILVHSYPGLEPLYHYVELERNGTRSFVTLDCTRGDDDRWQFYGPVAAQAGLRTFTEKEALELATRRLGSEGVAPTVCAVQRDKMLYWYIPGEGPAGIGDLFLPFYELGDVTGYVSDGEPSSAPATRAVQAADSPAEPGALRDTPPACDLDVIQFLPESRGQVIQGCGHEMLEGVYLHDGRIIPLTVRFGIMRQPPKPSNTRPTCGRTCDSCSASTCPSMFRVSF